jgi:hypothetical protein
MFVKSYSVFTAQENRDFYVVVSSLKVFNGGHLLELLYLNSWVNLRTKRNFD